MKFSDGADSMSRTVSTSADVTLFQNVDKDLSAVLRDRFYYIIANMIQSKSWAEMSPGQQEHSLNVLSWVCDRIEPEELAKFVPKVGALNLRDYLLRYS